MKKTIVNFACSGREPYVRGQARLVESLRKQGEKDFLLYSNKYPPGSPTHQQVPYAFKYYAMQVAFDQGADLVFWLDASIVALKPLDPLWKVIEERGILVIDNAGAMQRLWTSQYCFDLLGCTAEKVHDQHQVCGGVVGYNRHNEIAMKVFNTMMDYAKLGTPFAGGPPQAKVAGGFQAHRHDQSCLTHLVYVYNIQREPWPGVLSYSSGVSTDTVLELRTIL
jgi:hypothetical protein